jgi:DHA1 family inner membrane transport protein
LRSRKGAGQSLASSFNIAAFNLGNAIGAWLGGAVIDHGPGLAGVTWVAALLPLAGFGVAVWALRTTRAQPVGGKLAECAAAE